VTVGIWEEISQSIPLTVSPEGNIILSPIGLIDVGGMTLREAEGHVRDTLKSFYPRVPITLTLTGIRTIKVHLSGEVYYPGSYEVTPMDRVFDLVQMAGGFLPGGSVRNIRIRRSVTEEQWSVDLERFLQEGEIGENPRLREGDIIHVPSKTNMILVRGEVHGRVSPGFLQQRPNIPPEEEIRGAKTEIFLEYRDGDMLSQAIMRAGGLKETADLDEAYILRNNAIWGDTVLSADLHRLFVLGDPAADISLQKGDLVEIPMDDRYVYVVGIVNNPGPIPYQANRTAYEYVGLAGGPTIEGSNGGWKVITTDGVKRRIGEDEIIGSGETIVVPERLLTKLGKVLTPVSAASTIIISIVALRR
jgi:protein involved in polysaccharide export with SLBB domain